MPELSDAEVALTDQEVVWLWMVDPRKPGYFGEWWYAAYASTGVKGGVTGKVGGAEFVYMPLALTLDRLHLVEARLTDEQSREYDHLLYVSLVESKSRFLYTWHATAEQKIRALASVLRATEGAKDA